MKQIYFVLTRTGTILSKIIKIYTRDEFSHSSIALDRELQQMYSFGRLNPYNAFVGGFVHEYIDKGTFKRFKNTRCKIFALDVEEEKYEKLKTNILNFEKEKSKYKFNIKGLFAVGFNIKYTKENYFYCAEFIKYITEKSDINLNLPELVRPESFKDVKELREIYKGLLRDYKPEMEKACT